MDELDELKDEVNAKLAATQSYSYSDYLEEECRVQIDVNLAKYLTKKETQASAHWVAANFALTSSLSSSNSSI